MTDSQDPFTPPLQPTATSESSTVSDPTYNMITDLVTGANLRKQDNIFQAIFIAGNVLLFGLIGAIAAWLNSAWNLPWYGGAIIGSFIGLVSGVITSGIGLMIYRAAQHLRGKHD
jgi:hypothetical protein